MYNLLTFVVSLAIYETCNLRQSLYYYIIFTVDVPTCTNEEEGNLRLIDGVSMYEGRVEVCTSGEWGTICNRYWNNQEAMVACRQLGFSTNGINSKKTIVCTWVIMVYL